MTGWGPPANPTGQKSCSVQPRSLQRGQQTSPPSLQQGSPQSDSARTTKGERRACTTDRAGHWWDNGYEHKEQHTEKTQDIICLLRAGLGSLHNLWLQPSLLLLRNHSLVLFSCVQRDYCQCLETPMSPLHWIGWQSETITWHNCLELGPSLLCMGLRRIQRLFCSELP